MQKGRMEMKKKWAAIAALSLLLAFGGTTAFAADILAGQASTITVQTSKGDQPLKLTNECIHRIMQNESFLPSLLQDRSVL